MRYLLPLLLVSVFACRNSKPELPRELRFYVGTYTQKEGHVDGKGDGIYTLVLDPVTHRFSVTDTIRGMTNPSYLALSRSKSILYAVNEIGPGANRIGQLQAFETEGAKSGKEICSVSTTAYAPCHIAVHPNQNMAIVSNYVGGVATVYPLPLTKDAQPQVFRFPAVRKTSPRQEDSHPHSAVFSPNGEMAYIADLGTDRVMCFMVNETMRKIDPAPAPFVEFPDGSGPRHMCCSADGQRLYVLCELSNQVAVLNRSNPDSITIIQQSGTLPSDFTGKNTSADIHLSRDGKYLYSSNRGHDSIAVFEVQPDGTLLANGHVSTRGKTPRNFYITEDGQWMLVANQDSDNIVLFDLKDGAHPVSAGEVRINTPVSIVEMR